MMKLSSFLIAAAFVACAVEAQVLGGRGAYNITFYTGVTCPSDTNTSQLTFQNSTAASVAYNCNASTFVNFVTQYQTFACADSLCQNCNGSTIYSANTAYRTDSNTFAGETRVNCNVTTTNGAPYYYIAYYAQRCCGNTENVCLSSGDIMFSSLNRTSQCIQTPVGDQFAAAAVLRTFANPNADYSITTNNAATTQSLSTTGFVSTTGVQSTTQSTTQNGILTTNVQTTNFQTTNFQTTNVQTTGVRITTGVATTGAGVREVASVISLIALVVLAIAF